MLVGGWRAAAALGLVLASCGGTDEPELPANFDEACGAVDGCESPAVAVSGPSEAIWRVLVVRDADGTLHVGEVQEIDVPSEIGPPQGPLEGDTAIATLDASGAPLELMLLSFPATVLVEGADPLSEREEMALDGPTSTVSYLRVDAAADRLAVVQPDGTVIDSIAAPAPGEARMEPAGTSGRATGALVQASESSACAHVILLEGPRDVLWYPENLREPFPLEEEVTPTQRAVVQAALGRVTATHCAGVGRIAFARFSEPRTGGMVVSATGAHSGDVVLINSALDVDGRSFDEVSLQDPETQALLTHTVIHESAHATTYLLNGAAGLPRFNGAWAPTMRNLALDTVDNVRLRGGFSREWARMHDSFIALGWSSSYFRWPIADVQKASLKASTPDELAADGFMSAYGGTNELEDIAETATWPITGPIFREAGVPIGPLPETNDYGCIAMRDHDAASVPASLASVYTKVSFLRGLGMLPQDAFDHCIGDHTGLPADREGFSVYQDGELQRVFGTGPTGVIGTMDGRYVFVMDASGTAEFGGSTYDASLELRIDLGPSDADHPVEKVSWPRGAYTLAPGHPNYFELRMPDAPAGDFDVIDGFVLVAEASNERIVGSVFAREAFRPHAPVPVPQTFDPPLQFRFLLSH